MKEATPPNGEIASFYAVFFSVCAGIVFTIFSIKIPYSVVGSLISTWVTAPTSLPS